MMLKISRQVYNAFRKKTRIKKDVEISVAAYTSKSITFHNSEGLYVDEKQEAIIANGIFKSKEFIIIIIQQHK